jgi:ABC-type branched-subunit amino acid transport system permease subunit
MISAFHRFAGGFCHYNAYIIPTSIRPGDFHLPGRYADLRGLYTIAGPIIGTIVIKAIEEYLRVTVSCGHQIAYGLILVLVICSCRGLRRPMEKDLASLQAE